MGHRPRVLVLTPDFPPAAGGIQLLVHRLAAAMTRLDPVVVAPGGDGASEFDRSSAVPVRRVGELAIHHRATVARLNAAAVVIAGRLRPDVILSAHIVTSPAASYVRKHFGIPFVQYVHANEIGARRRLAEFAIGHADAVIAVSRHTCRLAELAGAATGKLYRIPPGVDLPTRHSRQRARQPTIITVARLEDRYKGHDTMIRALPIVRARVPTVRWVVVGAGPRRRTLERLADIYGVSTSVSFLGELSNDERDVWLERAHVFAMPSRVPGDGMGGEGFGIVYLEAAWHELPVVAGDAGGAVDAVADGETGLLVDANDPVAVADALTTLLLDTDLRRTLGRNGAARTREFTWARTVGHVEDLLLSLHSSRDRPVSPGRRRHNERER